MELESLVGLNLFQRNHQLLELTEPGQHLVREARNALLRAERAVLSARVASRGADDGLNFGSWLMPIRFWLQPFSRASFLSILA